VRARCGIIAARCGVVPATTHPPPAPAGPHAEGSPAPRRRGRPRRRPGIRLGRRARHRARPPRPRLLVPPPRRVAGRRRRPRPHRGARDPAGLGGGLDLPLARRAPAGHRPRRGRAQAVPLPPPLAGAPRRGQVQPHGTLRGGAAGPAGVVESDLRRRALSPTRCTALAVRLLDETLIRIGNPEYAEWLLRADHPARPARRDRRRDRPLQLRRQEREGARGGPGRSPARAPREGLPGHPRLHPLPVPHRGRQATRSTPAT
jgi:hypothetical protein